MTCSSPLFSLLRAVLLGGHPSSCFYALAATLGPLFPQLHPTMATLTSTLNEHYPGVL